jgi:hypothetical protein
VNSHRRDLKTGKAVVDKYRNRSGRAGENSGLSAPTDFNWFHLDRWPRLLHFAPFARRSWSRYHSIDFQPALPEKCQGAEYAVPSRSPRVSKGSGFCQNFDLEPSLTVGLLPGQNPPNHFSGKVGSTDSLLSGGLRLKRLPAGCNNRSEHENRNR